jgi:hypothetical protein
MANKVKVFRLNLFDWWAGYDLTSVKLAYLVETGVAKDDAFDEEEELPQEAMRTMRIYPNPYAKESSTFQEELARMVADGHEFPCYFAGRYTGEVSNPAIDVQIVEMRMRTARELARFGMTPAIGL